MEIYHIILIIIVVIILLWLIFGRSTADRCVSELDGLWIADDEFCNESGIELMTFYFGKCPSEVECDTTGQNKLCWILIINDQGESSHITVANIKGGKRIKGEQYEFHLDLQDTPDNLFSTSLQINIVPGQLITIIDPESDSKVFEGTKNKEASELIYFDLNTV